MKFIAIIIVFLAVSFWVLSNKGANQSHRLTNDVINHFFNGKSIPTDKKTLKLYATSWCGYCAKTRQFFKNNKINYIEYDIEKDVSANKRFKALNGRGVPLIEADNLVIRGYNEFELKKLATDSRYKLE